MATGKRVSEALRISPRTISRTMKASEFKAKCLELMDEVQRQQIEILVTKHGRVVAKLAPAEEPSPASPFGFMRGTVIEAEDIVAPDPEAWVESDSDSDPLG
jgi:prevent-host-death family protein